MTLMQPTKPKRSRAPVAIALLLGGLGVAAGSVLLMNRNDTTTTRKAPVSATTVVDHLKEAGLPVGESTVYTAESDPNELLGRPNQYVGKAIWHDTRKEIVSRNGKLQWDECGGSVEVFDNQRDLERRRDYIERIQEGFGPALGADYMYESDRVLVRISKTLTPAEAEDYERALMELR